MYVYKRTEPNLWTVGFYTPEGKWEPDSDHDSPSKAAERVQALNSGDGHQVTALRRQVEELREALEFVTNSFYAYLHDRGEIEGEDSHPDGGYWDSIRMARAALARYGGGEEVGE